MGHVQDRWWKDVGKDDRDRPIREKTEFHGNGMRYRVRYLDPNGRERSQSFPDRQKSAAGATRALVSQSPGIVASTPRSFRGLPSACTPSEAELGERYRLTVDLGASSERTRRAVDGVFQLANPEYAEDPEPVPEGADSGPPTAW